MANVGKIIEKTYEQLDDTCKTCSSRLSEVDKEISDIYHYIEFSNLDAYRGWKAYKLLKDKLKERREIKDDYEAAIRIRKSIKAKVKQINHEKATKKYTPRKAVIK